MFVIILADDSNGFYSHVASKALVARRKQVIFIISQYEFKPWHVAVQGWVRYEVLDAAAMDGAYTQYRNGGPSTIQRQMVGRPETYTLNFVTGIQTNTASGETRPFRRR